MHIQIASLANDECSKSYLHSVMCMDISMVSLAQNHLRCIHCSVTILVTVKVSFKTLAYNIVVYSYLHIFLNLILIDYCDEMMSSIRHVYLVEYYGIMV